MYNEYDEYDDYSPSLQAAQLKRQFGRDILAECDTFLNNLDRKASITKQSAGKIISKMFAQAPHAVAYLRDYVRKRGLNPANSVRELVIQFTHLRGKHIDEVVSSYDADNFGFGKQKGKERRRTRRDARKARKSGKKGETPVMGEDEKSTANTDERNERETAASDQTSYRETQRAEQEEDLVNPTESDAHAEIIGEEFMGEGYDKNSAEGMSPYIAGALKLGNSIIAAAKKKGGASAKEIVDLVKKEGDEQVKGYKKRETGNTLRENAPIIACAVLALLFVGAAMTSE